MLLLRWLTWAAAALSPGVADRMGRLLGWAWYRLVPIRRGVARANVRAALGGGLSAGAQEAVVRGMYRHLGRSLVELLRFSRLDADELLRHVEVRGRAHLDAALGRGGVLLLTAHLGNWELLVRLGAAADRPAYVVTKRMRSGLAERLWRGLRVGGAAPLQAGGSARVAVRALGAGGVVGYVLDQHMPPRRAVWVPFFGRPAATSPDLARLARLTGAAVLPAFTWRDGDRHVVAFDAPLPLPADELAATAALTARVEAAVRAHPEQWLWIHRRWKPPPAAVAQALRGADAVDLRRGRRASSGGADQGS